MLKTNIKDIHIGSLIHQSVVENKVEMLRICNFLKCSEEEIENMYKVKSLNTEILLRWSKLLEYDFFRVYTQHLILFSPPKSLSEKKDTLLPQFRKNIYTKEVIDFVLEMINSGEKTKSEVIKEYEIPKTTLYKWIAKYKV